MTNPLVSVIIPNYNHARYLDERIQSVLNQTYQNFEVIILDDCSPDNGASRAVIEHYRNNKHISHIVYNEQNSGKIFSQWHKGFELAKGDLVWIAESDDKCEHTLLRTLVTEFERENELILAFCKTNIFDDWGNISKSDPLPIKGRTFIYEGSTFISKEMSMGCPMLNASACLFKKEVINKIEPLYMNFIGAGDRMFWTEVSEYGKIAVVNLWLNCMRSHPNNSTKRNYLQGINQREDKLILDYIYNRGYISKKEKKKISYKYVRTYIYRYLTDPILKNDLYKYWEYGFWDKLMIKIKNNRITDFIKKYGY